MSIEEIHTGPALFVITGPKCAACTSLKPKLVRIAEDLKVELRELDAVENIGLVRSLGIRGVPAVIYMGKTVFMGDWNEGVAEKLIAAAINTGPR